MTLKLVVTTNAEGDVFELILKNSRYGVGRRHDNDLRIKETYISGYHAEVVRDASGNYAVADLGSSNGTFLNGRRIAGKEIIKAGDILKFGILKVEVKEQVDGMPKIVELKDRSAFSQPGGSGTSAIVLEKKSAATGSVAGVAVAALSAPAPAREPVKTAMGNEAVEKMWQARLDAEKKISAEHQKAGREREEELKGLNRRLEEALETLTNTQKELASVRGLAETSAKEAKAAAAKLESSAEEAKKTAARVAATEAELKQAREELAHERSKSVTAEEEQARLRSAAKEEAARETAKARNLSVELTAREAEIGKLRQQVETITAKLAASDRELSEQDRQARERAAAREAESERVAGELAASRRELADLRRDLDAARSQSSEADQTCELLRKTAQEKEGELAELATNFARSSAELKRLQGLEEQLAKIESTLAEERGAREKAETDLATRDRELATRLDRLQVLEKEIALIGSDADATRQVISRERDEWKKRAEEASNDFAKEEARARKEVDALAARVAELEGALEKSRLEVAGKATALGESEKRSGDLESRVAALLPLAGQLAAAEAALREAHSQAGSLDGEKSQALERIAALEGDLRDSNESRRTLSVRLEEKIAAETAAKAEHEEIVAKLEKSLKEVQAEAKSAAKSGKEDVSRLEKQLRKIEGELEKARLVSSENERRVAELSDECEQWRERSGESVGAFEGLKAELTAALAAHVALSGEKESILAESAKQIDALQSAKSEANALRMELNRLREESEKSIDELNGKLRSRVAELDTNLARERIRAEEAEENLASLRAQLGERELELKSSREESDQLRSHSEESARTIGRLQADLGREVAERTRLSTTVAERVEQTNRQLAEIDQLKLALESKEREIVEREQTLQHQESEAVQKLKASLAEQESLQQAAEEKAARVLREKQTLAGSFERLRAQLEQTEEELRSNREAGEALKHAKGLLARRLEKEEASNVELAARIKEEAIAALAHRELIEKLEQQIRENESEAVQRERDQVLALQADLSRASRRAADDERRHRELASDLARVEAQRRQAEERILALENSLVERDSETIQTRELLAATEGQRVELVAQLAGERSAVESHARAIESLRQELADTHARFTTAESAMVARHHEEQESVLGQWRTERGRREGLEVELANTREGLSEALRHAREDARKKQAELLAQGNEKLSAVEEELTRVIRSREEVEQQRNALEDELNQREEEIEALAQRVEDLETGLREELEARQQLHRHLDTTREGFSTMLRSNWDHLAEVRLRLSDETEDRVEAETELAGTRAEIARLNEALDESQRERRSLVREWEDRYETLRQEKLTLASEDADLRQIRDQIQQASSERRSIEDEITALATALRESQTREAEFRSQRETLLAEREQLKAGLNAARLELSLIQKRTVEFRDQAAKQEETIASAERRIQALRKLENEIGNAVERKRQQQLLSRGDVFSDAIAGPKGGDEQGPDEEFFRKLIAKLDLIDDLAKRYDNKWLYPRVAEQLGVLKRSFVDFLQDHSVRQFDLQPGTVLSLAERKRIKLVPLPNGSVRKPENGSADHPSYVVETLRPGYVFQNGDKDVIIRKAEVVVS